MDTATASFLLTRPAALLRWLCAVVALGLLSACVCMPFVPDQGLFLTNATFAPVPTAALRVGTNSIVLLGQQAQQVQVMTDGRAAPTALVDVPAGMLAFFSFYGTGGRFLLLDFHTPSAPATPAEFEQVVVDLAAAAPAGHRLQRQSKLGGAQLHIDTSPNNGLAFFVWYGVSPQGIENAAIYRSDTGMLLCSALPYQSLHVPNARVQPASLEILDGANPVSQGPCSFPVGQLQVTGPDRPFGSTPIGTTVTRQYTFTDVGSDCCAVSAILESAHFKAVGFTPDKRIDVGASQAVSVEFDPKGQTGTFTETLMLTRVPARGADRIEVSATAVPAPTTTIEVRNAVLPASDPTRFDLSIDAQAVATGVGNGGTSGPRVVTPGPHTVSATGAPAGAFATTFSGDCAPNGVVVAVANQARTCIVTNVGGPRLTLSKVLRPATDLGRFDLQIDGVTRAAGVGNGGTTGPVAMTAGPHRVGEASPGPQYAAVIGGDCAADGAITLAAGQDKACTITNTIAFDQADVRITSAPDSMPGGNSPNGGTGTVTVTARNTGTTTWVANGYAMRLVRTGRISVANNVMPVITDVAPNGQATFTFAISCNGFGTGGISLQMAGATGLFQNSAGKTIVCQ
jgi:hypothetical protein